MRGRGGGTGERNLANISLTMLSGGFEVLVRLGTSPPPPQKKTTTTTKKTKNSMDKTLQKKSEGSSCNYDSLLYQNDAMSL